MPSEKRKKMKSRGKEEKLCIFMIQGIFFRLQEKKALIVTF